MWPQADWVRGLVKGQSQPTQKATLATEPDMRARGFKFQLGAAVIRSTAPGQRATAQWVTGPCPKRALWVPWYRQHSSARHGTHCQGLDGWRGHRVLTKNHLPCSHLNRLSPADSFATKGKRKIFKSQKKHSECTVKISLRIKVKITSPWLGIDPQSRNAFCWILKLYLNFTYNCMHCFKQTQYINILIRGWKFALQKPSLRIPLNSNPLWMHLKIN